jgi:hypothetical protein
MFSNSWASKTSTKILASLIFGNLGQKPNTPVCHVPISAFANDFHAAADFCQVAAGMIAVGLDGLS